MLVLPGKTAKPENLQKQHFENGRALERRGTFNFMGL
jgi:hypothetical protein